MPSEPLLQYRVWCSTENSWVLGDFRLESAGVQTTCPNDTGHTLDSALTVVVETIPPEGTYDSDGNLATIQEPRPGTEKYFYVPNLCDKCAWYEGATYVDTQVLADSGDNTTYTSPNPKWIDLTHGRVFKEDQISNRDNYIPVVEVDSGGGYVTKTENSWGATDNDYTVNYDAGTITFNSALGGSDTVRASYYYGGDSKFTIAPDPGKRLKVLYTEVQFTKDVELNSSINFEIWVYNPNDLPNKMLYKKETYKRLIDFFQESTGPFPTIAAFGNAPSNDRGIGSDVITLPFSYQAYRDLKASLGTEMRVTIDGNTPLSGEFANATFYCLSEDES
jgi:hypothetical protein